MNLYGIISSIAPAGAGSLPEPWTALCRLRLGAAALLCYVINMKKLRVLPAHDVPLIVGADATDTVFRLRRYLVGGAASFSYDPARTMLPHAMERTQPVNWLISQVNRTRPPTGHEPNAQVVRALCRLGSERTFVTYDAPRWCLPIRADMDIPIYSDRLVVEHGRAHLFWMQMRTTYMVPDHQHLGLLGRLFLIQAERAGYMDVGLMIADMRSVDGDERSLSLLSLADLPLASVEAAEQAVQLIAHAYDHLIAEGFDPHAERRARREQRPDDGPQPGLF